MAGTRITITPDDAQLRAGLLLLQSELGGQGMRALMQDIGEAMYNSTLDRAAQEESPDGIHWLDLSPRYARYKAKERPGLPMLKFDDHMLGDRFTYQLDGDNAVEVGTNAVQGATQQFGRGPIPARPWLGISEDDTNAILEIGAEHLQAAIDRAT